jgi:hypothetical protein
MTRAGAEGAFTVDLGGFPLVRLNSPDISQYDQVSVPSYFACLDLALAKNAPFVILHDVRGNPPVSDANRREFLEHLEPRRARIEQLVIAYASTCGSPLERAIITAFTWFIKLPLPIRIFTSETEARTWLLTRYESARKAQHGIAASADASAE